MANEFGRLLPLHCEYENKHCMQTLYVYSGDDKMCYYIYDVYPKQKVLNESILIQLSATYSIYYLLAGSQPPIGLKMRKYSKRHDKYVYM